MGNFAKIFKMLRQERNLSQQELAERMNISKSTVGMYEQGKREPNFETLEMIADFFNVDTDYLIGRSDKTTKIILPETLAAHFDGSEYTAEELEEIKEFAKFVKSKRK